jgi:NADPH:quinone reductase-like Zn-dependent oxidoreductase
LLAAVASGTVRPIVAATFSLDEIARAHELMERGDFFGKIVIRP